MKKRRPKTKERQRERERRADRGSYQRAGTFSTFQNPGRPVVCDLFEAITTYKLRVACLHMSNVKQANTKSDPDWACMVHSGAVYLVCVYISVRDSLVIAPFGGKSLRLGRDASRVRTRRFTRSIGQRHARLSPLDIKEKTLLVPLYSAVSSASEGRNTF